MGECSEEIEQAMQQVIMYHQNLYHAGSEDPTLANTVLSDIPLMSDAQQGRKAAVQAANTLGNLIQAGGQLPKNMPGSSKGFNLRESVPLCLRSWQKKLEEVSLLRCMNSSRKSGYTERGREKPPYPVVGTSS